MCNCPAFDRRIVARGLSRGREDSAMPPGVNSIFLAIRCRMAPMSTHAHFRDRLPLIVIFFLLLVFVLLGAVLMRASMRGKNYSQVRGHNLAAKVNPVLKKKQSSSSKKTLSNPGSRVASSANPAMQCAQGWQCTATMQNGHCAKISVNSSYDWSGFCGTSPCTGVCYRRRTQSSVQPLPSRLVGECGLTATCSNARGDCSGKIPAMYSTLKIAAKSCGKPTCPGMCLPNIIQ